jgi:hypothetical protein
VIDLDNLRRRWREFVETDGLLAVGVFLALAAPSVAMILSVVLK